MEDENKKNNILLGILGALLGALIGTIPWIILYVYANMIYTVLALIVAYASFKGYELFKGKPDKKLPFIIAISSLLAITVATLIIIPNLLLFREFGTISITNFKLIYETEEVKNALIGDYIYSLVFTALGIWGIISTIRKQVENGNEKIDLLNDSLIIEEDKKTIRDFFESKNALSKENAISKEEVFDVLDDLETEVNILIRQGVIRISKKKYYYVKKMEDSKTVERKNFIIIAVSLVVLIVGGILLNNNKDDKKMDIVDKEITYTIPKNYQEYEKSKNDWYYVPKKDISGKSGVIYVTIENEQFEDYKEFKELLKTTYEDSKYNIIDKKEFTNKKDLKIVMYTLEFDLYKEYIYFIYGEDKYAYVDALDYNDVKNSDIESKAKDMVTNFNWK